MKVSNKEMWTTRRVAKGVRTKISSHIVGDSQNPIHCLKSIQQTLIKKSFHKTNFGILCLLFISSNYYYLEVLNFLYVLFMCLICECLALVPLT